MGLFSRNKLDVGIRMLARVVSGQRTEVTVQITKDGSPVPGHFTVLPLQQ